MNKIFYPAIFHKAEEGGFWVSFPDIPECMTQGDDMQQTYEMAVEALELSITSMKEEGLELPTPSEPYNITLDPDSLCAVIEFVE